MQISASRQAMGLALVWFVFVPTVLHAQDGQQRADEKKPTPLQIPDEPKTVDPATLVPKKLATAVTVHFADSSLREIVQWIQTEQKIPALFDSGALTEEGIPLGEPVADHLEGDPIYLLLNRLRSLGLSWYVEDDVLHITTITAADERMSTESYNVSDLFDAGYKPADLEDTIHQVTEGPWDDIDGAGGSMEWLGDVLFARQTDPMHREIKGLLTALRKHGRQTFTLDPPQHMILREKLEKNVSVKFVDDPLIAAVRELAEKTKADIRLDSAALREEGLRDREPVTLTLSDRKLSTVLRVLLADFQLTWIPRDGVLWITTITRAEEHRKTAVYDVRDLCRNQAETTELTAAIQAQTAGPWEESAGSGGTIAFPQTGTMAIRHTESGLREVLDLLTTYRKALLASKLRKQDVVDPKEVVTRYYRMHERIADDLVRILPQLVQPETWQSDAKPDAAGYVLKTASGFKFLDMQGMIIHADANKDEKSQTHALVASQAVLIIHQTRAAHEEIAEVIRRVEQGDAAPEPAQSGMGGMGGGFGSGYFSVR